MALPNDILAIDSNRKLIPQFQNQLERCETGDEFYWRGHVQTFWGFVIVYSQGNTDGGYTYLEFIREGRLFRREYHCGFTSRQLVQLAKRFAADVAQHAPGARGKRC
jgi:hypothetical protein